MQHSSERCVCGVCEFGVFVLCVSGVCDVCSVYCVVVFVVRCIGVCVHV